MRLYGYKGFFIYPSGRGPCFCCCCEAAYVNDRQNKTRKYRKKARQEAKKEISSIVGEIL